MTDQNKGEEKLAEAPAQDAPTSESQEQPVVQPEAQPQESPETETGKNEVGEAPKDNAAWAAKRVENKKLKEENERLKEALDSTDPKYLESLRGAVGPQEYPQEQIPQVSGDADYTQVTQGVNYANAQALRARQETAQLRNQLELQQDREAERAYPQLKTDKVFQQIVAEKKLAARVLGHDRTTIEIAEEVERLLNKHEEQVVAKASEETKAQILERQAISSEPKGQTTGGQSSTSNEDLRMRVRKGDQKAQEEVAKNIIADLEF